MPLDPTCPGVRSEEVQGAIHTIVGVPTSVAAFVGYAFRGPVDTPVPVNGWADYERTFGTLDSNSPMSYAVYLFFVNGGSRAQIVRVGATDGSAAPTRIEISPDVILAASSPGAWGDALQVTVDSKGLIDTATQFNLTITDAGTGATEAYTGVSLSAGPSGITMQLGFSTLMGVDPSSALSNVPTAGTYKARDAGVDVVLDRIAVPGDEATETGIYALVKTDGFNMLCLPTTWDQTYSAAVLSEVATFCAQQRAMLIVDPPTAWSVAPPLLASEAATTSDANQANAATYYPNLVVADPASGATVQRGPCGAIAGLWARTDDSRGVWKAPAGTAATISGISDLAVHIDDGESRVLNSIAVNCLRTAPLVGPVIWGARTMAGTDELASQWKYIPVRRTALFIEESLRRGTQWVVFELNDELLWSSVRLDVGAFMNSLFKEGAFQGSTPVAAYFVKCDADNNPQSSIDQGVVNITVGFAPLVPAEFVIIQIQQLAHQHQS